MEIREFLRLNSSRLNAEMLADKLGEDPELFDLVWSIMLEDEPPLSMRAAWSISIFAKKHPGIMEPRIPEITALLPKVQSASVRRCMLNLLTLFRIPEDQSGFLFDYCLEIIESPGSAIGHRAYAMTILYNISEQEPDLKPELISFLETHQHDESPGIEARCRIIMKRLNRDLSLPEP